MSWPFLLASGTGRSLPVRAAAGHPPTGCGRIRLRVHPDGDGRARR
ncbi:hypothetical protein MO973_29215 [Paenibacillus sp. TRM 82003]|nr:hypothetical protein [Paenibacillus sp. TRM 82003]